MNKNKGRTSTIFFQSKTRWSLARLPFLFSEKAYPSLWQCQTKVVTAKSEDRRKENGRNKKMPKMQRKHEKENLVAKYSPIKDLDIFFKGKEKAGNVCIPQLWLRWIAM